MFPTILTYETRSHRPTGLRQPSWDAWSRKTVASYPDNKFQGIHVPHGVRLFEETLLIGLTASAHWQKHGGFQKQYVDGYTEAEPSQIVAIWWVRLVKKLRTTGERVPGKDDVEGWKPFGLGNLTATNMWALATGLSKRAQLTRILWRYWPLPHTAFDNWPESLPLPSTMASRPIRETLRYRGTSKQGPYHAGRRRETAAEHQAKQEEGGDDYKFMMLMKS